MQMMKSGVCICFINIISICQVEDMFNFIVIITSTAISIWVTTFFILMSYPLVLQPVVSYGLVPLGMYSIINVGSLLFCILLAWKSIFFCIP
jgi:hypothetical protein